MRRGCHTTVVQILRTKDQSWSTCRWRGGQENRSSFRAIGVFTNSSLPLCEQDGRSNGVGMRSLAAPIRSSRVQQQLANCIVEEICATRLYNCRVSLTPLQDDAAFRQLLWDELVALVDGVVADDTVEDELAEERRHPRQCSQRTRQIGSTPHSYQ